MEKSRPKTILTVFSGRYDRMKVLIQYLQKAIALDLIQEVHLWNYTRKIADEYYIRSIANLKRVSHKTNTVYEFFTSINDNQILFQLKGQEKVCIYIQTSTQRQYEVWLGVANNRIGLLREGKQELSRGVCEGIINGYVYHTFMIQITKENELQVYRNNQKLMSTQIPRGQTIERTFVKSIDHPAKIRYSMVVNKGFYLMDTCIKKPWSDYYQYYIDDEYQQDVILKCDDDIMFIDLHRLSQFIHFCRNNPQCDLIFANTVNNGVSAFFQQNVYNWIPKSLMELEYPEGGVSGSLWDSGEKAHQLHRFFLTHSSIFLSQNLNSLINILSRFSINFFAIKGEKWSKLLYSGENDEEDLTVKKVANGICKNYFYSDFVVSHLSFFKQEDDPRLQVNTLIELYDQFANQYLATI